jgi:hypothetical protein
MAERENQMELRFNRRMDRAEQRMDRADERMEKFDRRLEATRKLVEAGMKIVLKIGQQQKANEIELRRLEKSIEAFVNSMKRGGNGSRHS